MRYLEGVIAAVLAFNFAALLLLAAAIAGRIPQEWYGGFLRGLHNTIGISTPNDAQLRWVLVVWIVSTVLIADVVGLLLVFVL